MHFSKIKFRTLTLGTAPGSIGGYYTSRGLDTTVVNDVSVNVLNFDPHIFNNVYTIFIDNASVLDWINNDSFNFIKWLRGDNKYMVPYINLQYSLYCDLFCI